MINQSQDFYIKLDDCGNEMTKTIPFWLQIFLSAQGEVILRVNWGGTPLAIVTLRLSQRSERLNIYFKKKL